MIQTQRDLYLNQCNVWKYKQVQEADFGLCAWHLAAYSEACSPVEQMSKTFLKRASASLDETCYAIFM